MATLAKRMVYDINIVHWVPFTFLISQHSADVNCIDRYAMTALGYGCKKGHAEVVDMLLNANAVIDIDIMDTVSMMTSFAKMRCAASLNIFSITGITAFHLTMKWFPVFFLGAA